VVALLGTKKSMAKLDLHGHTIHTAWKLYRNRTEDCYNSNIKNIVVVIGHGLMSAEFQGWVSADPYAIRCERLDPNLGAWRVYIKKSNSKLQKETQPVDLTGLYKKFNK
jgi:hypothetical protein